MATAPGPEVAPDHAEVGSLEAAARNLPSICCLSETVAVALIAAERFEMREGPLRDHLTRIWADECRHAAFGWRTLRRLLQAHPELVEGLNAWLPLALAHLDVHELAHLPPGDHGEGAARLGLCAGQDARRVYRATVAHVILPGLAALGLDAVGAHRERIRSAVAPAVRARARAVQAAAVA